MHAWRAYACAALSGILADPEVNDLQDACTKAAQCADHLYSLETSRIDLSGGNE